MLYSQDYSQVAWMQSFSYSAVQPSFERPKMKMDGQKLSSKDR